MNNITHQGRQWLGIPNTCPNHFSLWKFNISSTNLLSLCSALHVTIASLDFYTICVSMRNYETIACWLELLTFNFSHIFELHTHILRFGKLCSITNPRILGLKDEYPNIGLNIGFLCVYTSRYIVVAVFIYASN